MRNFRHQIPLRFTLGVIAAAGSLSAAEPMPLARDYWKSEAFKKSFNGSYRINARLEPYVDTKERVLLIEVQKLMAKGRRKSALAKLKASSLAKSSAAVMFNIGNVAYELGDLKLAEAQYKAAVKKFPSFRRALQNLGFVLSNQDRYDEAFTVLLEAVRLGSQEGAVLGLLGYCHQQKENFTSALQAFRMAQLTEPENVQWQLGEAYCHDALGDAAKAVNLYQAVLRSHPENARASLSLANLYQRLGRQGEAIVLLEYLRRNGRLAADMHLLLGEMHLSAGSRDFGVKLIREELAAKKPLAGKLVLNLVRRLLGVGELELAEEFHQAIQPAWVKGNEVRYKRLKAWIMLETDVGGLGADMLAELVKQDPLDADSLFLLARYHASRGEAEKAPLLYQQASRGKGEFVQAAQLEGAKLLVKLGDYQTAIEALEAYLEQFPSKEVEQYLNAVRKLHAAQVID